MGFSLSWFFAVAAKHLINMLHYFGVAGLNQVWGYLRHQFLDVRHSRSVVGNHGAAKTRGYWVALLRVFLGFMWIVEATNKMAEGYLNFGSGLSKTGWMFSKGVVQAGVKAAAAAADTVTAATQAAAEATTAATAAAGQAGSWAAEAATAATQAGAEAVTAATQAGAWPAAAEAARGPWLDLAKPILDPNWGIVTWFRRTFMDGLFAYVPYTVFQVFIVMVELLIGLALFGGLFTWVAAVASIGMCVVFTLSGMFAWNQLWFVFAGVLMLGGAGKAFGLDHWVMPWLQKWWNGTRFARRTYFYEGEPTVRKTGKK